MPRSTISDRLKAARWAAPGLVFALGCAAPRAQFNAPLVSVPAYSGATRGTADSANRSTQAISRPSRTPATSSARRSDLSSPYRGSLAARTDSGLERGVARFVAKPSELFRPPATERYWRYIVLHHSGNENGGLSSIDRFHREVNNWDECGYHFVIGNGSESGDGEIEVGSRWPKQKHGAHTKPGNNEEYNETGIGVCLVGNFNNGPPTQKQTEAARRLVAYLQARYDVPASRVLTHGDVVGTHTECPGANFPLDRIMSSSGFAAR